MSKKIKDKINVATKKELIEEFKKIYYKFIKKYPKETFTRDEYRKHTIYIENYKKYFKNYTNFRQHIYELEGIDNHQEKKIHILVEENKELKKKTKTKIKREVLEDEILDLYKNNLSSKINLPVSKIKIPDEKNGTAILMISDVHLGEVIKKEDVNGINEYNKKIAIKRLNTLFAKFEMLCKKHKVSKCHLFFNGDLLDGGIQHESIRNSDLNEVESIFYLEEYLIMKLTELSKCFNRIDIDVIVGNHGRILQGRPYFKEKITMNYEYILGMQLKMYFDVLTKQGKNNKIFITVPKSSFIVRNVNGNKFLVTHGDIFSGGGTGGFGGLPFYSILMSAAKFYGVITQIGALEDVSFNHILMGHYHTIFKLPIFNGGYCFGNGCINGTNEFGLSKVRSVAKKEQLMLIISDKGLISNELCLKVD